MEGWLATRTASPRTPKQWHIFQTGWLSRASQPRSSSSLLHRVVEEQFGRRAVLFQPVDQWQILGVDELTDEVSARQVGIRRDDRRMEDDAVPFLVTEAERLVPCQVLIFG